MSETLPNWENLSERQLEQQKFEQLVKQFDEFLSKPENVKRFAEDMQSPEVKEQLEKLNRKAFGDYFETAFQWRPDVIELIMWLESMSDTKIYETLLSLPNLTNNNIRWILAYTNLFFWTKFKLLWLDEKIKEHRDNIEAKQERIRELTSNELFIREEVQWLERRLWQITDRINELRKQLWPLETQLRQNVEANWEWWEVWKSSTDIKIDRWLYEYLGIIDEINRLTEEYKLTDKKIFSSVWKAYLIWYEIRLLNEDPNMDDYLVRTFIDLWNEYLPAELSWPVDKVIEDRFYSSRWDNWWELGSLYWWLYKLRMAVSDPWFAERHISGATAYFDQWINQTINHMEFRWDVNEYDIIYLTGWLKSWEIQSETWNKFEWTPLWELLKQWFKTPTDVINWYRYAVRENPNGSISYIKFDENWNYSHIKSVMNISNQEVIRLQGKREILSSIYWLHPERKQYEQAFSELRDVYSPFVSLFEVGNTWRKSPDFVSRLQEIALNIWENAPNLMELRWKAYELKEFLWKFDRVKWWIQDGFEAQILRMNEQLDILIKLLNTDQIEYLLKTVTNKAEFNSKEFSDWFLKEWLPVITAIVIALTAVYGVWLTLAPLLWWALSGTIWTVWTWILWFWANAWIVTVSGLGWYELWVWLTDKVGKSLNEDEWLTYDFKTTYWLHSDWDKVFNPKTSEYDRISDEKLRSEYIDKLRQWYVFTLWALWLWKALWYWLWTFLTNNVNNPNVIWSLSRWLHHLKWFSDKVTFSNWSNQDLQRQYLRTAFKEMFEESAEWIASQWWFLPQFITSVITSMDWWYRSVRIEWNNITFEDTYNIRNIELVKAELQETHPWFELQVTPDNELILTWTANERTMMIRLKPETTVDDEVNIKLWKWDKTRWELPSVVWKKLDSVLTWFKWWETLTLEFDIFLKDKFSQHSLDTKQDVDNMRKDLYKQVEYEVRQYVWREKLTVVERNYIDRMVYDFQQALKDRIRLERWELTAMSDKYWDIKLVEKLMGEILKSLDDPFKHKLFKFE